MLIRKLSIIAITAFFSVCFIILCALTDYESDLTYNKRTGLRIMFYNVENLFDWFDDPLTSDDEFIPEGQMHWTKKRFMVKLNKLYQVIVAAGEWEPPEIIALAEVENRFVLNRLFSETPLLKYHYEIVHK